jgi:hypothetical protein
MNFPGTAARSWLSGLGSGASPVTELARAFAIPGINTSHSPICVQAVRSFSAILV